MTFAYTLVSVQEIRALYDSRSRMNHRSALQGAYKNRDSEKLANIIADVLEVFAERLYCRLLVLVAWCGDQIGWMWSWGRDFSLTSPATTARLMIWAGGR